ncbi:uncharacterized protein LOC110440621 [Mizuhopecten yessoensis]|uniref:uncharacterized protein LOC110440621 n=1 Tax=Mizuhopecten yessoensis TaxID=6573 RepID=UPI000B45B0F3|nr:uncharacterized protein LOC110440621 [Mizuhopecten yessoensis]
MNRFSFFALCVLLAVCLLGAIVVILYYHSLSRDVKSVNVFNISFSASFNIDTIEHDNLGTEKTYLKIEWNPTTRKMNFQQNEVFSSNYDFDYELFFIMTDDKATIGLSHMNSSLAFCIEDISLLKWLDVFQHIVTVDNWRSDAKSSRCRGDIWFTKHNGDIIEICTYDNHLDYVKYQNDRAMLAKWTTTDERNIRIRSDVLNGPCGNVTYFKCNNLHNVPKVKRDSGISPTTCLFVHGAGENANGNDVKPDLTHYWGDIKSQTSDCASHKFLVYNSRDNGWDEDQIHQHFCNVAATNGIITDTVIFSHSMGNLVIAAALHRQKCTFNQVTSRWYSVQGPWTGSVVANTLSKICRNPTLHQILIRRILRAQGYCKPTEDREFDVYTTLKTDYISPTGIRYHHLIQIGKKFVSGVMCGTSNWGLAKHYTESFALKMMQFYSNLEKPNDGMVALESCKLKDDQFEARSSERYYKDKFNHADGTCRNGGCPCKWYHYMH